MPPKLDSPVMIVKRMELLSMMAKQDARRSYWRQIRWEIRNCPEARPYVAMLIGIFLVVAGAAAFAIHLALSGAPAAQ